MKKYILTVAVLIFTCISANAAQISFESWTDLTPIQRDKLAKAQFNYKQQYNKIETGIMEYNSKLNEVKADKEKTPEQISVLAEAYERNIKMLKNRQKQLDNETDNIYKMILTPEQYDRLQKQQTTVQNSFDNFLDK